MTTKTKKLLFSGYTKTGCSYRVTQTNDEILFVDGDGDTLTWELNDINLELVKEAVRSFDTPKECFTEY